MENEQHVPECIFDDNLGARGRGLRFFQSALSGVGSVGVCGEAD
jgi:hypothetical protein